MHALADEVHIFEAGRLIAVHSVLEGRHQRRVDPAHRRGIERLRSRAASSGDIVLRGGGDTVAQRPLAFYDAVARAMARQTRLREDRP